MRIDIYTIFPDMFNPLSQSIIGRAQENGIIELLIHDIRDYTNDKHKCVDDPPYGGGSGMVMKPEPIFASIESLFEQALSPDEIILVSPQGRKFSQDIAETLSSKNHIAIICGHYEGVDERVRQSLITDELSIGDYVLTGGEIPAMAITDAVVRLIPNVLGSPDAASYDSFSDGLLEHPHYTRPRDFRGMIVPDILLSGNHQNIKNWRRLESIKRTLERRPDLIDKAQLSEEEKAFINTLIDKNICH